MDFRDRLEILYYTSNCAIISYQGYAKILADPKFLRVAYPEAGDRGLEIYHRVDGKDIIFRTSSDEFLSPTNRELFIAWQIALGIAGMTSILEHYLKETAERITKNECRGLGVFYQFETMTGIQISKLPYYEEIHKYYQVRHITMHNIGRVDKKFKEKTQRNDLPEDSYPFFVQDLAKYRTLLLRLFQDIELRVAER